MLATTGSSATVDDDGICQRKQQYANICSYSSKQCAFVRSCAIAGDAFRFFFFIVLLLLFSLSLSSVHSRPRTEFFWPTLPPANGASARKPDDRDVREKMHDRCACCGSAHAIRLDDDLITLLGLKFFSHQFFFLSPVRMLQYSIASTCRTRALASNFTTKCFDTF